MSARLTSRIAALTILLVMLGAGIGLGAGYLVWGPQKTPQSKIIIAIQPTEAVSEIIGRAKEVESFLEARVEADIEIYIPTTYAAVIEAIRFGNAHVAFMSAWPAYVANRLAGAEVVLAEVREVMIGEEKTEEPFYFSYYVVSRDKPYASLAELKGKTLAVPSPFSTSGYIAPLAKLVELGLIPRPISGEADPKKFFGEVLVAGGYAQAWEALRLGQADVAVIAGDISEKLYREVLENTRIIEKQGPIPSHAVVFGRELNEPLRTKLIDALIELGKSEHRDVMRKFISAIFVGFKRTTTEEHLAGLTKALELTRLTFMEKIG